MELIKKLGTRKNKNGNAQSWGLFYCTYCYCLVERILHHGKRDKSCGCQQHSEESNEKRSKSLKGRKVPKDILRKRAENPPFYGKKHTEESKQKIREAKIGKKATEETRQLMSEAQKERLENPENNPMYGRTGKSNPMYGIHRFGNENPNWNNGSSFEPYAPEFNKEFKQQVLERDNYKCQDPNCDGTHKKLHIHHIDYNKNNNNLENLITLCSSCHTKTNGKKKRMFFTEFYKNIIEKYYV